MGRRDFLFIGHRTTGKTTLAQVLSVRGWDVVDLDHVIEASEQKTCAAIIAESVPKFRDLERRSLAALCRDSCDEPRIIVVGAGCLSLPETPVVVWLRRDGWVESAHRERERLRPTLSFGEEVEWMRSTREPVWSARADLLFDIPRGRGIQLAGDMLETLLGWVDAKPGAIARKSWLVAPNRDSLARCSALAIRLGFAGIEVRSDLIDDPTLDAGVPTLASLRTPDANWLHEAWRVHGRVDCDLEFADLHEALDESGPESLTFSAHPPPSEWRVQLRALLKIASERSASTKFAPAVRSAEEVREVLDATGDVSTVIPQGLPWAWLRPLMASERNSMNYVALGLASHRLGEPGIPPFDLRDWLPHLSLGPEAQFDALIGQPAWPSQGDIWHRSEALEGGQNQFSYVKIDAAETAFETTVDLASALGIRGFSVTSPFKPDAGKLAGQDKALNTLIRRPAGWSGCDTDQTGMKTQLEWIAAQFDVAHTCSLLGKGGVSAAVLRGIQDAGWTLLDHRGAREGWTGKEKPVGVVINGAGNWGYGVENPPECGVWLDLHYADTRSPPVEAAHVIGDIFFEAQARAQRAFWSS